LDAGIGRTSWPIAVNSQAQWWAEPHASMPTRQVGIRWKNASFCFLLMRRLKRTASSAVIPWTLKRPWRDPFRWP